MNKKNIILAFIIFCVCIFTLKAFSNEKNNMKNTENKNLSKYEICELGDLVGDDVKRLHYKGYFADYHKKDFSKKQVKEYMKTCFDEGVYTQYQLDCCMTKKMYGE